MSLTVIKASGQSEEFRILKLVDSLIRSGASENIAWDIARKVEQQITPSFHTKQIFRLAKRLLRQYNRAVDMRYSLKKAIYALGPAGYQFEKYFAGILKMYGYSVELDRILQGYCVSHEVDVFAHKDSQSFVIECKYHSNSGNPTDVKVALYIHSRFTDIKKAYDLHPVADLTLVQGWLVTNTRCTSDAIKYAECAGLKIVSWKYPENNSLEKMIETKRLYPVTVLSSLRKNSLDVLFRNDILFAQEIADTDEQSFIKKSGLDAASAGMLKKEADAICCSS
jgi:hypothetical protein